MKQPLEGIIPPLVTPLLKSSSSRQQLDVEATQKLIDHVIEGGCGGIFILGTTGEWPSLSMELKVTFIRLCCKHVNKRIPVLVGITDTCFENTISLARECERTGADCLVLTAPYYYPMDQEELIHYVNTVREESNQLGLPIMLYNMPGLTKVRFDIEILRQLIRHPDIVGIKDSSEDLEYFQKLCKLKKDLRPDWTVLMGPEHLTLDAIRLGGDGGVNGGANVHPKMFVQLHDAATKQDWDKAEEIQKDIIKFQDIYHLGTGAFPYIAATKCALAIKNLCSDTLASPFRPFSSEEAQRKIRHILESIPTYK